MLSLLICDPSKAKLATNGSGSPQGESGFDLFRGGSSAKSWTHDGGQNIASKLLRAVLLFLSFCFGTREARHKFCKGHLSVTWPRATNLERVCETVAGIHFYFCSGTGMWRLRWSFVRISLAFLTDDWRIRLTDNSANTDWAHCLFKFVHCSVPFCSVIWLTIINLHISQTSILSS